MKKYIKNMKGITLVALTVTIVALLILSTISINLVIGNNGIINKAKEAKEESEYKDFKDEIDKVIAGREMDRLRDRLQPLYDDLNNQITGKKIVTKVDDYTCYVEKNGKTITVYDNGRIEEEKIEIWNGIDIKKPIVKNNVWEIYTTGELKYFADFVNGKIPLEEQDPNLTITEDTIVKLMNNLDLGARHENGILKNPNEKKWEKIGYDSKHKFIGTFDGQNHYITGIYLKDETAKGTSLFYFANNIKNLTIKDCYFEGIFAVSGIASSVNNISNCHNENTTVVLADSENATIVGGIAGNINVSGDNLTNTGNIIAKNGQKFNDLIMSRIGGICGQNIGKLTNSRNYGKITTSKDVIGGIAAQNAKIIENCTNYGKIIGNKMSGGICGSSERDSQINFCENFEEINGSEIVGGISGKGNGNITHSKNYGEVYSLGDTVGGICGKMFKKLSYCANYGNVISEMNRVGGIAGILSGNLENCFNKGDVKGKAIVGGIVSAIYDNNQLASIENCSNFGKLTVTDYCQYSNFVNGNCIGGIVGGIETNSLQISIKNNYNVGILENIGAKPNKSFGEIVGGITENLIKSVTNNYFNVDMSNKVNSIYMPEGKTTQEMKDQIPLTDGKGITFVEELNGYDNISQTVWEKDIENINNGYPILNGMKY